MFKVYKIESNQDLTLMATFEHQKLAEKFIKNHTQKDDLTYLKEDYKYFSFDADSRPHYRG